MNQMTKKEINKALKKRRELKNQVKRLEKNLFKDKLENYAKNSLKLRAAQQELVEQYPEFLKAFKQTIADTPHS